MNITIVLPSLNPDKKLNMVVDGLIDKGFKDIVIVNDGSDEAHMEPFQNAAKYDEVTILTHEHNKGKGRALKTAFSYVCENRKSTMGVVTVDGDNQHRPEDIQACAEAMIASQDKVVFGCRKFSGKDIPLRSRFGNVFTSGVFRLFCGIKISDTQTGLRAIPSKYLPMMCDVNGERFEYETEMFFALKRSGIKFEEVKIQTVYIEDNESSHFNPIKDSIKIYKIILRFMLSSCAASLIDFGLFTILVVQIGGGLDRDLRLLLATFIARVVSSLFNYTINKKVVFKSDTSVKKTITRYYMLCVVQTMISYGLVYAFSALFNTVGILESIIKIVVDVILFIFSFQIQQRWVFKK